MPYNRIINAAGSSVTFGDPQLENHSLDLTFLPGNKFIAVEDRYGIALFDAATHSLADRLSFEDNKKYKGSMSTFSGIKAIQHKDSVLIFWGAGARDGKSSFVIEAFWNGKKISIVRTIPFPPLPPADIALPNEVEVTDENGTLFLYVALNGNNQLIKVRLSDLQTVYNVATGAAPFGLSIVKDKMFVTNWGGRQADTASGLETAGIPWGSVYTDPRTGATAEGTVSVFDKQSGKFLKDIHVGLHPNAIIKSTDGKFMYVANGNSDFVSVINTATDEVVDSISVSPYDADNSFIGSSPNGLALDSSGQTLYVSNGLDNAVCVIQVGSSSSNNGIGENKIKGYIPTEAYPSGLAYKDNMLYVTNLEAIGARVNDRTVAKKPGEEAYFGHKQLASVSFIPVPDSHLLEVFTKKVKQQNLMFRAALSKLLPRKNAAPKPVPERIGEPSVFKHVVYIIKENKTYDQVMGDVAEGRGMKSLCVFGDSVTPNQHRLAKDFQLMDNYYASGKSSAEGHQWTDAGMVTDYIEKNVRAWFRSYPHRQYDAMVYSKEGFIWNNALDHGKSVRIYGEACDLEFDPKLDWTQIYNLYLQHQSFPYRNVSTIGRVRPILSQTFPGYDNPKINDQLRAETFIKELKEYENKPGDQWPQLMIMSLPNDHTTGTSPGYPTPRAMVADNDLALGKITEAITKSRFWDSTVIFVTEDDTQSGWDHISAYRTTCFIISPYSRLQKTIHTNYNQTSMFRTIEQILGIPPMNTIDATAMPMFDCFTQKPLQYTYTAIQNKIPLNEMNKPLSQLKGKALHYAKKSLEPQFAHIDGGSDALLNRIIWFATKGNQPYPSKMSEKDDDD